MDKRDAARGGGHGMIDSRITSFGKMFMGSLVEAVLFTFGINQLAGTIVDLHDGDMDASVWIVGAIGIVCLAAIVPIYKWSVSP